ncbi:hypothetical protein AC1659_12435 [Rhodococcus erythropolis]|jgi:hypothetical protein|uniref:hypothetical protein n=1 Tax=Rhodococcus erythropolis TaxID=1833 RepID=UPI001BADFE7E|nr:hypothetical protein [Rhodococcus erythropolis]MBS2990078.1 hypothetical protein [Rhodococcus erythropolis]
MTATPWEFEAVSGTKVRLTNRTGAKAVAVAVHLVEDDSPVYSVPNAVEPDASFVFKTSGGLILRVSWTSLEPQRENIWPFET